MGQNRSTGLNKKQLPKKIKVEAYSGYKANERPLCFFIDDLRLEVRDIIDRWYGEEDDYFKVLADDGKMYLIKWNRELDYWALERILL